MRHLVPLAALGLALAGCAAAPVRLDAAPGEWSEAPAAAEPRHAADERFFLTPSPLLLEPGTAVLSDDEVLLVRLGVGAGSRLQLDLTLGALPIPGAAGGAVPAHGILAGGGAGVVVLGVAALGAKLRLLDEGPLLPAIAVGYDFVDLFGGAVGGAGFVILGAGVAGGAAGAVGGANLQLNLFTLVAGKHLGDRVRLGGGLWVIDNHHLVPQVAGFTSGTTTGSTSSGSATIARLPTRLVPFLNGEVWLGGGFSSILELVLRDQGETFGTAGLRWVSGRAGREGVARWVRVKLDAGVVYGRGPDTSRHPGGLVFFPWAGAALYLF